MPNVKTGKRLFKVYLSRKSGKKELKQSIHTQAMTRNQAERFAHVRKPGWRVTRIVEK